MAEPTDSDIRRSVQRVMTRHWVDLAKLFIFARRGTVRIQGDLERQNGAGQELTPLIVETIMSEARRERGVRDLSFDFENWEYAGGTWRQTGKGMSTRRRQPGRRAPVPA